MSQSIATSSSNRALPTRIRLAHAVMRFSSKISSIAGRFQGITTPIANAISLGLLDKPLVSRLVEHSYKSNPSYYDPGNYDYTWEEEIIDPLRSHANGNNLLVAFCGKGRESRIFARHEFKVTGIDRESFMIEDAIKLAQSTGLDSEFLCVDFDEYKTTSPYDVVYTSTWMYTTYLDLHSRLDFLKKCEELRSPDGVTVISYRTRKDNRMDAISFFVAKTVGLLTLGNRSVAKGDRIENGLFWHYFTEAEIEHELQEAGVETCYHKPSENGKLEWRFIRPRISTQQR